MLARANDRKEPRQRGQLGHVSHGAAHGWARGLVLGPDMVRRLARDGQPAARLTSDLDHDRTRRGETLVKSNIRISTCEARIGEPD